MQTFMLKVFPDEAKTATSSNNWTS